VRTVARVILAIGVFWSVTGTARGAPGLYGTKGLLRVLSADSEGKGRLSLNLHGQLSQEEIEIAPGQTEQDRSESVHLGVTYAPVRNVELALSGLYRRSSFGDQSTRGLGDTQLSMKLNFPVTDMLAVGASGFAVLATGDEAFTNKEPIFGGRGIATFDMAAVEGVPPFRLHLNGGYMLNQREHNGETVSTDDMMLIGAGLELPSDIFTPFVEYTAEYAPANDSLEFAEQPMRTTLGVRFETPIHVSADLGIDLGLSRELEDGTKAVPNWNIIFGLSWTVAVTGPAAAPQEGGIVGAVRDAETGEPLAAVLSFPGIELGQSATDPVTGGYEIPDLPAGVVTIEVSAEGYRSAIIPVVVRRGQVTTKEFALQPVVVEGIVTGTVTERETGRPLAATISFPGTDIESVETDPETGTYRISVPAGAYTVGASFEGYIAQSHAVTIEEGATAVLDCGRATIRPDSYPELEVAAEFLKSHSGALVEIHGHTDSQGDAAANLRLSLARANAVRDYLVDTFDIDPAQLVAKGFGEEFPVADDSTPEGRAQNRRIEFMVVRGR
jgi:hypothetical protein